MSDASSPHEVPASLLAYAALKRALVPIRMNLGKRLRAYGDISLVQYEIMFLLEQAPGGLRMHELADAIGLSRGGTTYQVTQLEDLGWVQRVSGELNSRAVIALLTEAGRERVLDLQEQHLDFMREGPFSSLSDEELRFLTGIFAKIADNESRWGSD